MELNNVSGERRYAKKCKNCEILALCLIALGVVLLFVKLGIYPPKKLYFKSDIQKYLTGIISDGYY